MRIFFKKSVEVIPYVQTLKNAVLTCPNEIRTKSHQLKGLKLQNLQYSIYLYENPVTFSTFHFVLL